MNIEPRNLFIGLVDLFSIWLPGALLTFLFRRELEQLVPKATLAGIDGSSGVVLFLFASYLLGHFVFLAGSLLLDPLYDAVRAATRHEQAKRLRNGKPLAAAWKRWLADRLFDEKDERAVAHALMIKESHLERMGAKDAINAFQWCKARLALENGEALETVQRFEADSKFFRSLCIVLLLLLPLSIATSLSALADWVFHPSAGPRDAGNAWLQSLALAALLGAAAWRFTEQRAKSVRQAYWFVIAKEAEANSGFALERRSPTTHAGGVAHRPGVGGSEVLLVEDSQQRGKWVLPKGHVEPGEDAETTALREVAEEAGCWASIEADLGPADFSDKAATVRFFLMSPKVSAARKDRRRAAKWFDLAEAKRQLRRESAAVLDKAEARIAEREPHAGA